MCAVILNKPQIKGETKLPAAVRGWNASNGADGISDIEGKVTRVGASARGQRTSFNGADGFSDIEGKAARVAARERGRE